MTQSYDSFSDDHTNHQFPCVLIISVSVFILQLDIATNNVWILDQKKFGFTSEWAAFSILFTLSGLMEHKYTCHWGKG